jgi:hypothetical protein
VAKLAPLEIKALVKIMDELDYYQILHLERGADAASIKRAFHSTSRTFHPDANRHLEPVLLAQCQRINHVGTFGSGRIGCYYSVSEFTHRRKIKIPPLTRLGLVTQLLECIRL